MTERQELEHAIAALEAQRVTLGDSVVDAALVPMRARLAELQARPAGEQRKLVTILFADLVGFTAMAEEMDPEDVRDVLNAYFDRWSQHIQDQQGTVEKFIGDAVMAVFGLVVAQEDDAERALRAALSMQHSLQELNQSLERSQGIQLSMRVGVYTGQVLVSTLGERQGQDFVVVGDSVNLASRLQSAAPPGGLIVSHTTYRLVRGVFDVRPLDPIQVKGVSEHLQTYLVLREKPRAFRMDQRGLEGIQTRLIGREAELKHLQDALYQAMQTRERQLVAVTGEAGVGKSRLLYAFDEWLDLIPEKVLYFKARASTAMTNLPYALLREMFSFRFEIHDSDPPSVVQHKLEAGVGAALGDEPGWQERAHYIGQLLGFEFGQSATMPKDGSDAKSFYEQALVYLDEYFEALALKNALVILLEDLQWADDSSLDLIDHLEARLAQRPVLIVCTARPALFERRPHWGGRKTFLTHIDLRRLSQPDSRRLVKEILRKLQAIPPELLDLIVSNAEGNPFYIEELIKMLIEVGVIRKGKGRWQVDLSRLSAAGIPPTLVGVLQARLDRLALGERLCLQRAAVIGRVFWDEAVAYLDEGDLGRETESLEEVLQALRGREMVFKHRESAFANTREYVFKHAMLRDVTYESLLKAHRRAYHARAAGWLETVSEGTGRAGEYAALIAEHHDRAGEDELAARWYRQAGEQAAAKYSNAEAVRFFSRALELTPDSKGATRYSLLSARQATSDLLGDRQAQARDLEALEELAESLGDERRRAEVSVQRGLFRLRTGEYRAARQAIQAAVRWIQAVPQPDEQATRLLADAYILLGRAARLLGGVETAGQELARGLALAQESGYSSGEVHALDNLGTLYSSQGDYARATAHLQRALPLAQALGDRRLERSVLNNLGIIAKEQGEYRAASDYYQQSQSIAHAIGDRLGESTVLNNLGEIEQLQGDYARAIAYTQRSLKIAREIGDRNGEGISLANLGEAHAAIGECAQARQYAGQALEIMRATGFRMGEGIILGNLGKIALTQDDYAQARQLAGQALEIAQEVGDQIGQGTVLQVLADALAGLGDAPAARAAYQQALAIWEEVGQEYGRHQALAGLARLALDGGGPQGLRDALDLLEPVLAALESNAASDAEIPLEVYWTCWQALQASQEPRAGSLLAQAQALLEARANRISEPQLRQSFLENNHVHRQLAEARPAG